jgi:vitamin B12 transporter
MQSCISVRPSLKKVAKLSVFALLAATLIHTQPVMAQSSRVSVASVNSSIDPVIVTATRTPTRANDVLADYVYIGPEEIADAGQSSLVQLLQRQRGVEISSNGGSGAIASVFLRGANSGQTLVLIDGVRSQSTNSGSPSWQAIPLSIIDHIEIIFGPQSSLYGSDAIGGVVQIFTKTGEGPIQVGASTGYGTYGTSISDASIYGSTSGDQKIRYSLSATAENAAGFNTIATNNSSHSNYNTSQSMGYTRTGAAGKLSQEWSKGQELGLQVFASRNNGQYPVFSSSKPIGNQINDVSTYALFSKNQFTDNWKSLLQIAQSYDLGQALTPTSNAVTNSRQNIYTWQNDVKVGSDLIQFVAEQKVASVFANSGNLSLSQITNSFAGAYQLKRGSHLGNASIRNDSISGYGPQTTGNLAYGYFFTNQLRANINYGTGFKAPSFYDLYYPVYGVPTLKPEKSKNSEIGLHYEARQYDFHLAAYSNSIANLIQYSGTSPPCTTTQINTAPNYGCASNVANAKINGLSLGGTARFDNLSIRGSFDQRNPIDESTRFVLAKRSRQFGNIGAEYKTSKSAFGAEGTFQANRNDYSNTGYMGGYAIYNLYGNYEFAKDWTLFGRWNNIFNKDYQLSYGYNTPGSNLFVGVRYAMK